MRISLTVLTLVAFSLTHAQEHAWVYNIEGQAIDIPNHGRASLSDGGVLVVGLNYNDTTFSALRLSITGDVVWYQALRVPGVGLSQVPVACHELPDGNLMILAPAAPISNSPNDILLVRLEPSGAPLWAKRFTIPDLIHPGYKHARMQGLSDGTSIIYIDEVDAYSILRVSSEGLILDFRTYSPQVPGMLSNYSEDDALVHVDDEGMLVARNTWRWDVATEEYQNGVVVSMLDTAGNIQWCRWYYFGDGARVLDMAKGLDNTYLLTGQTYELGTLNTFGLKVGSSGEVLWRRNYWRPDLWAGYGGVPTALPDSEFMLQYHGHVLHLAPDGSIISDLVNVDSTANVWGSIVEANDQQLRFIGNAFCTVPGWTSLHGALDMRLPLDQGADCVTWGAGDLQDTVATVDSTVITPTSVSEMTISMSDQAISSVPLVVIRQRLCDFANPIGAIQIKQQVALWIYPTPSDNLVQLRLSSSATSDLQVTVHDGSGRVVMKSMFPSGTTEITLDLSGLAAGIYGVRLSGNERSWWATAVRR